MNKMFVLNIKNDTISLKKYSEIAYPKFIYSIDTGINILYKFFDIEEKLSNKYRCMLYLNAEQYKKFNENNLKFEKNLQIIIYKNDDFEDMDQKDLETFKKFFGHKLNVSSSL